MNEVNPVMKRKGIVLAGGSGSRLYPITQAVSKQLLPIYDKPMVYYSLSVLMFSGIREIAIITTLEDQAQFVRLLGDGSQWGIDLSYIIQPSPDGIAQAYILAETFLNGAPSALVLGDNIFFGDRLPKQLSKASDNYHKSTVFACHVADPERYGVVEFGSAGIVKSIEEKPAQPKSSYAVTGLYFLDGRAPSLAKQIKPSNRGELEITDLLDIYLKEQNLIVEEMGRGFAWFDTGTHASLLEAGNFVHTLQARQGLQVGCLEEIAFENDWIDNNQLMERATMYQKNDYGRYLTQLASQKPKHKPKQR